VRIEGGRGDGCACSWCSGGRAPACLRGEGERVDARIKGGRGAADTFTREGGGGVGGCGRGRRRELGFSSVLICHIRGLLAGRRAASG
jgi:hypothetical protein